MIMLEEDEHIERKPASYAVALFSVVVMNAVFSFDSLLSAMALTEGGHVSHLQLFGHEITQMNKATFYLMIFVMVTVDVVQYSLLAATPMLITPGLFLALAEGWLDLGGGEKDILLALPYFLWALIFFVVSLVLIVKGWPLRRWLIRSGIVSISYILILGVFAFVSSWLGVG